MSGRAVRGLALQAVVLLPFIDLAELQTALEKIPDFFGYSAQGGEGGEGAEPDGTPEGMHQWLEDEVAGLHVRLLRGTVLTPAPAEAAEEAAPPHEAEHAEAPSAAEGERARSAH